MPMTAFSHPETWRILHFYESPWDGAQCCALCPTMKSSVQASLTISVVFCILRFLSHFQIPARTLRLAGNSFGDASVLAACEAFGR